MSLPSYEAITRQLGIPRCRGILPNGQYCQADHAEGEIADGKVHWGDARRVTHAGIRRYLALEAWRRADEPELPTYWVTYRALRLIPVLAAAIHVRLPARLGDLDRATLRASISKVEPCPEKTEVLQWLSGKRRKSGGAPNAVR